MELSVDEVRRRHAERRDKWGTLTRQPDLEVRRDEMFQKLASQNRRNQTAHLYSNGGQPPPDADAMLGAPHTSSGPGGYSRRFRRRIPGEELGAEPRLSSSSSALFAAPSNDVEGSAVTQRRRLWLSNKVLLVVFLVVVSNARRLLVVLDAIEDLFRSKSGSATVG